jgi:ABC-2 type transport system ATP-binding protein
MPASQGIQATSLVRSFGDKRAVSGISLDIAPGTITGILGPNGSGKSTTLRMLVGLVRPDSGTANIAGVELKGDGTAVRKVSTFAPGEIALYGEMAGGEHLDWLLRGRPAAAKRRGHELIAHLGLPPEKKVHAYSHGMKRQLLFAAAMAPDVPVRILDEPTEGLDPAKRQDVLNLIEAEAARGALVLLSSHHLSEVQSVCERLIFFNSGKVLADESPAELARRALRTLRIEYESDQAAEQAHAAIQRELAATVESSSRDGEELIATLTTDDARTFLAAFAALDAPRPSSLTVGKLSLTDLYRTVYGVSGL